MKGNMYRPTYILYAHKKICIYKYAEAEECTERNTVAMT